MADNTPSPTPEGQLIRQVRDLSIPKLTIRAAAALIGLSAEQWGYIERGYYPARDGNPPRPFSPPAVTLAKMAHVLDITPERLESEGQRPDAAEILREIQRGETRRRRRVPTHDRVTPQEIREYLGDSSDGPPTDAGGPYERMEDRAAAVIPAGSLPSAPESGPVREDLDLPYFMSIWDRLLELADQGVRDPSGAQLGLAEVYAKVWDDTRGAMSRSDRAWVVADIQRRLDARNRQDSTG